MAAGDRFLSDPPAAGPWSAPSPRAEAGSKIAYAVWPRRIEMSFLAVVTATAASRQ
jgi:hypothetical protein